MKRKRFTKVQSGDVLREHMRSGTDPGVRRRYGISEQTHLLLEIEVCRDGGVWYAADARARGRGQTTEAHLENAALKISYQETGAACGAARSREPSEGTARHQPAPGVLAGGAVVLGGAVSSPRLSRSDRRSVDLRQAAGPRS